MARGERGKSGQRAPRPCRLRLTKRSEEGRVPGEAPTAPPAPPHSPRAAPDWQQGGGRSGGQRTAADLAVPPTPPRPVVSSLPSPLAPAQTPQTQKKARPPGPEPSSSRSRSARSSIPGRRSRARGRREGAIQRGCAGMLPGHPVAAVRLPAPASWRSPRRCWTRAAWASLSGSGVAWRGVAWLGAAWLGAAGGASLCRGEAGARTPARKRRGARESGLGAE